MTKSQIKLQLKTTALNKIRKIYHPKNIYNGWDNYEDSGSYGEQRSSYVESIIRELEKDLATVKHNKKYVD